MEYFILLSEPGAWMWTLFARGRTTAEFQTVTHDWIGVSTNRCYFYPDTNVTASMPHHFQGERRLTLAAQRVIKITEGLLTLSLLMPPLLASRTQIWSSACCHTNSFLCDVAALPRRLFSRSNIKQHTDLSQARLQRAVGLGPRSAHRVWSGTWVIALMARGAWRLRD